MINMPLHYCNPPLPAYTCSFQRELLVFLILVHKGIECLGMPVLLPNSKIAIIAKEYPNLNLLSPNHNSIDHFYLLFMLIARF